MNQEEWEWNFRLECGTVKLSNLILLIRRGEFLYFYFSHIWVRDFANMVHSTNALNGTFELPIITAIIRRPRRGSKRMLRCYIQTHYSVPTLLLLLLLVYINSAVFSISYIPVVELSLSLSRISNSTESGKGPFSRPATHVPPEWIC